MQIVPFLPHYQLVYINFDFSSFSLISYYQTVADSRKKRCLIRLQKGVSNSPKGHLLQANWALIDLQLTPNWFAVFEFYLQYGKEGDGRQVNRLPVTDRQNDSKI